MNQKSIKNFYRCVNQIPLNGIRVTTLQSLLSYVKENNENSDLIIADLSLGAWRSHQVAHEFALQLGVKLQISKIHKKISESSYEYISFLDLAGEIIDDECKGESTILRSFDLANQILGACNKTRFTFVVLVPYKELILGIENINFIRFFTQNLNGNFNKFFLVSTKEESFLPKDWNVQWVTCSCPQTSQSSNSFLSLIPGIVDKEIIEKIDADTEQISKFFQLRGGSLFIPPEYRIHPNEVSKLEFDTFATEVNQISWLKAYAQFFGNNYFVQPLFLYKYALDLFLEGGIDIALNITQKAISCSTDPVLRGFLQCFLQNMYISLRKFNEISNIKEFSSMFPMKLTRSLLEARGWGLVMTGKQSEANACLLKAMDLIKPEELISSEYLFLLNITALTYFKLGNIEKALSMEKELEIRHKSLPCRNWQLEYINCLNSARIYRRLGKYEDAKHYYLRAFSTSLGGRSESDLIYANVCFAKLEEERGDIFNAFTYWMRASLHWVSSKIPEGLSRRVATAILGYDTSDQENIIDKISIALISNIQESFKGSNMPELDFSLDDFDPNTLPPDFVRSDFQNESQYTTIKSAVLWNNCSVLITEILNKPRILSPNYNKLQFLLYKILNTACHFDDFTKSYTIVIDDSLGYDMPSSFNELLTTCIRLRIHKILCNKKEIIIEEKTFSDIEMKMYVKLTDIVEDVNNKGVEPYVSFKRYYSPKIISAQEEQILTHICSTLSLQELQKKSGIDFVNILKILRLLENSRIVKLYLPEQFDFNDFKSQLLKTL